MTRQNKQINHLKKARNCKSDTKKILEITNIVNAVNNNDHQDQEIKIHKKRLEKKRIELIDNIKSLSDDDIVAACHLFKTMTYPKGDRAGRILSPYIVNKVKEFVIEGLYKQSSSVPEIQNKIKELEKENKKLQKNKENIESNVRSLRAKVAQGEKAKVRHIGMIRSAIQKNKKISQYQFRKEVEKKFKSNKKEYSPELMKFATSVSNTGSISISSTVECVKTMYTFLTGQEPEKCITTSTISRWNKEVAHMFVSQKLNVESKSRFFSYGVMVDESTRGDKKIFLVCFAYWNNDKEEPTLTLAKMKDIDRCTAIEVANTVIETCNEYDFDTKKCNFWLTDNTAYMSGIKSGAVIGFNLRSQSRAFRIPCGVHSVHIAVSHFENEAFGKLNSPSGLSLHDHPFNLLNLAYHLHDGYKDSDKDNPINMKSETIKTLYWTLFQYPLKQYQKPITSRWLYQLKTAKQYLKRKEFHLKFATWFVNELENSRSVPKTYIKKWQLFIEWLQNPILNIQIKFMVKFGESFYEKVFVFLTGFDPTPRIFNDGSLHCLPLGNRAHELPDQVLVWLRELEESCYFSEEYNEANITLLEDEFENLNLKINLGVKKALESFSKWMGYWTHLPLSICRLGGDYGPEFARAVGFVILNKSFNVEPNWHESSYIESLQGDLSHGLIESFGLFEALKEQDFLEEFLIFAESSATELHKFPLIYSFVKHRIWSIIVHQQQIEGMFNKYDIKTHPNQTICLQEARMQMSCSKDKDVTITKENLAEIRNEIREKSNNNNSIKEFGDMAAKNILKKYVK